MVSSGKSTAAGLSAGLTGLTHIGCVRARNEDSILFDWDVAAQRALAVVADGMGGHVGGAIASSTVVASFDERWQVLSAAPYAWLDGQWLQDSLAIAQSALRARAQSNPALRQMGTTVVALLLQGRMAHLAHIGDSRGYLYSAGNLRRLTRDHSAVQQLVDAGELSEAEAENSPLRHLLTRSLAPTSPPEADMLNLAVQPGDVILLCSDGLTNMLGDHEIASVLAAGGSPGDVCNSLLDLALARGATDNVSVILCAV